MPSYFQPGLELFTALEVIHSLSASHQAIWCSRASQRRKPAQFLPSFRLSLLPSSHRHDAKAADRRRDSLSPCISFLHFPIDFTSLPLPLFKRQVVLPQGRIPSRRRSRHGEAPLHFRSNVNACQKSFTAPASSQEPDRRAIVWLCGAELRR